jgi:hypothetical protein
MEGVAFLACLRRNFVRHDYGERRPGGYGLGCGRALNRCRFNARVAVR